MRIRVECGGYYRLSAVDPVMFQCAIMHAMDTQIRVLFSLLV